MTKTEPQSSDSFYLDLTQCICRLKEFRACALAVWSRLSCVTERGNHLSYVAGDGVLHLLDFFPSGSKNWEVGTSAQRTEGLTDKTKGLYCLQARTWASGAGREPLPPVMRDSGLTGSWELWERSLWHTGDGAAQVGTGRQVRKLNRLEPGLGRRLHEKV